jgi:hypothetical protein
MSATHTNRKCMKCMQPYGTVFNSNLDLNTGIVFIYEFCACSQCYFFSKRKNKDGHNAGTIYCHPLKIPGSVNMCFSNQIVIVYS